MDDNRLLQESNLAARQPQGTTSVIQAISVEGLAQGPYVVARGGVEPTTFRSKGTNNLHLTNHTPTWYWSVLSLDFLGPTLEWQGPQTMVGLPSLPQMNSACVR